MVYLPNNTLVNVRKYKMKYTAIVGALFTSMFAFGMAPFNESACCSSTCFGPLLMTCIQPGEELGFERSHGPDKKRPTKFSTEASSLKAGSGFGRERELPANMIEHVMAVANEIDPELASQLSVICETDPEAFRTIMMKQGRRFGHLIRLREDDPELFEVKVTELKTDAEIFRATEELRGQDIDSSESQAKVGILKGLVRIRTAISLRAQTLHIGRLEKHIEALRKKLKDTTLEFDEIVETRFNQLLRSISKTKKVESPQEE